MFSTVYYGMTTMDEIMGRLTWLKKRENDDDSAHRELEAIAAVLRVCGVEWRFCRDDSVDGGFVACVI